MTTSTPRATRRGFTLIEIVLAIGLTAMVVYLLTTAIEMYLTNVEASRTRVETAQLARTLLDQIAADLAAARLYAPGSARASSGGGLQQASGGQPGGAGPEGTGMQPSAEGGGGGLHADSGGSMPSASGPGPAMTGATQGVYGNAQQLRIDRAAYANWERAAREIEPQEAATSADMPASVRYFFVTDNRVSTQRLAQQGVAREFSTSSAAGLYRETIATSSISPADPPLPTEDFTRSGAQVELLAPEVVAFELTYFDGVETVEEWDPMLDGGLPMGVEIRLTIAQPRLQPRPNQDEQQRLAEGRYRDSELIEFRRFVRLPLVAASPPAQALMPIGGQQGGGAPLGGGPQRGPGQGTPSGQTGGAQPGGTP